MSQKPGSSSSFAQIERLAGRTLRSSSLPDAERSDLKEILQIARRGRDLHTAEHEAAPGAAPVAGAPSAEDGGRDV